MITKTFSIAVEKAAPTVPDSVGSWVISSSNYDRVNDRITQPALKSIAAEFNSKGLICLYQHDADRPVGVWKNVRMLGDKLVADLVLAKTNLGEMLKELLAVGTPIGASIGFRAKGKQNEKGGIDFLADGFSMLETSLVSVPANADAVMIAKKFNIKLPAESVQELDQKPAASGDINGAIRRAKLAILAVNRSQRK